jgi:hypothetical protein
MRNTVALEAAILKLKGGVQRSAEQSLQKKIDEL